jgi:hypothetical protein
MATWASVRLEFLRGFMSRAAIRAETGLTTAMQEEILTEKYIPIGETRNFIRNLYQRTAYDQLKDAGFSASQASRFRGYAPVTVLDRMETLTGMISDLAKGALDQKLARTGIELGAGAYDEALTDYMDTVREGFSHSSKTYEEWMDYGRH